ncbi:uncharacterized protein LOC105431106 [Pogonomyrmex barbatus]|uniref:Uncharacterized protein LOC105431106 n=1 Tax=Pogonomyrmex barbatus TaxID=144034 RepID=A0A6I9WUA1_9HYME|nr:uncharacterized protein LOC105431106 [Pogonomyrmex barbatus]
MYFQKNKYNHFFWQQSWHCAKVFSSKKNTNEYYNKRSIQTTLKNSERYELKRKKGLNFQRTSIRKKKPVELTFWKYIFDPKKFSKIFSVYWLTHRQRKIYDEKNLHDQATRKDVLVYNEPMKSLEESKKLVKLQLKPLPKYKMPIAVLLNNTMKKDVTKDISVNYEKSDIYEDKIVTSTASRKPYEEMKPPSNIKKVINIKLNGIKPYEKPISIIEACDDTTKVLRQAMMQEEPPMYSRIERLKILINEKITKSESASETDSKRKNLNG